MINIIKEAVLICYSSPQRWYYLRF